MNLATIESTLYDRLSYGSTPATAVITKLRRFVNAEYHRIMGKKHMSPYRRAILPFTSIASSPYAVLPQACTRIYGIQNRTNQQPLEELTIADLRRIDPGNSRSSSTPEAFVPINMAAAVARQPSDASELFVDSDSASDTNAKTAYLEGVITGGYTRSVSVALNGTTAVSFGATITSWIEVRKFYIALTAGGATTAAGNITLHEDASGGTELARIPIGRYYPRYTQVQLYPYPDSAVTFYADVDLHIEDLAVAGDEPLFPEDYHELIVEGVLMREYELREKPVLYSQSKARHKELWSDLVLHATRADKNKQPPRQFSQLGPYFSGVS